MTRALPLMLLFAACGRPSAVAVLTHATWVDLSYPFDSTTIYWPTAEPFRLQVVSAQRTPGGYWYAANNFAAAEHGSDLFDGGIVAPVVGWTEKYAGLKKLSDADVWTKLSREAVPLIRSEPELLTGVQRAEGFQRA